MPSDNNTTPAQDGQAPNDRISLLEKARAFLISPVVRNDNAENKRRFLREKGLTNEEIDNLMDELHQQPPPVPPRTYPLPPPSNLPFLLASLFRIVSWSIGLSGVLALAYYKCLLPRISRSLDARRSLKLHQTDLLKCLHTRLHDVRQGQSEAFKALDVVAHLPENFKSFNDIPLDDHGLPTCSLSSVIYCAFSESSAAEYTVDTVHELLTKRYPGLESKELKSSILQQISQSTLYTKLQGDGDVWILRKCENSLPTLSRLENLHRTVRQANKENRGTYSYTFKALTDLTAYISRETFVTYGGSSSFRHGFSTSTQMTPAQEEVRREIRALKGLVLNRRSFAPIPPRASVPTTDLVTPSFSS